MHKRWLVSCLVFACAVAGGMSPVTTVAQGLRVGTFVVDASPAIGSPLAYDPTKEVTVPLSCRGIVIVGQDQPIVLCAIDWLGVANQANVVFREKIAQAVGTDPGRVVVHSLHQHDAPRCDLSAVEILQEYGQAEKHFDVPFIHDVMDRTGQAAKQAAQAAVTVATLSYGEAEVREVASNRRMLGPDGIVHTTRYTACKDPSIRELPVGVIDPWLKSLTFNGAEGPIAVLTFYATHPQSYYRTGGANPDFPGMARDQRQQATGVFHLHFNGAGGNIGAGKYNDGSPENRQILADRVADGMRRALETRQTQELPQELSWSQVEAHIPVGQHLAEPELVGLVADDATPFATRCHSAEQLAFLRRANGQGLVTIPVSRLRLGSQEILFMPGELFVEYQLAAAAMKPKSKVMMAAYGDYGTGYIGTRVAYPQGGYEVSDRASNVSPAVESALVDAMRSLLEPTDPRVLPSDFTERSGPLPEVK
ncbi:MAG: hypothetical protein R3C53_05395 [Pirellulaceae bacterium]